MTEHEREYYSRQMKLSGWSEEAQQKLKAARVIVIGAGALGCAVLQSLARAGVGTIQILDHDSVSLSNLQRQILFDSRDVGKLKASCAAHKLKAINPGIEVTSECCLVDESNVRLKIRAYDLVIDGSDNFKTKYLLNDACVLEGKALVFAAIEEFSAQISVFNYHDGPTYRCLFPSVASSAADCDTIGVTPALPQIAGALQANEAIKIITGTGEILSGKILLYDSRLNSFSTLSFRANPESRLISQQLSAVAASCTMQPEVSALAFSQLTEEHLLVDVREEIEHATRNAGGRNIPLYEMDEFIMTLSGSEKIVTYCNSGVKAKQAAILISSKRQMKVFYLDSFPENLKSS